jgi:tetratricopeptide (TPR) repeat protein
MMERMETHEDRRCPECSQPLALGEAECPHCKARNDRQPYHSETVLILTLIGLAVLFVITGFAARLYHAKETALGEEWYARGEQQLKAGQAERAVADFRTALVYSRDDYRYELRLAQALLASGHVDQARAYLLSLWEHGPEDSMVSLELGRLATHAGDVEQSLRYFHSAIYGNWGEQDAAQHRREARLELYRFLITRGAKSQAQGELMALTAELPPDPRLYAQVGELFLRAEEYHQALNQYREALRLDPSLETVLAGAGEAEFHLGNYRDAQPYLERAVRKDPHDAELARMLDTTNLILNLDPYAARLSAAERSARVARTFKQALAWLEECAQKQGQSLRVMASGKDAPPQTPWQRLYEQALNLKRQIRPQAMSRDPDLTAAMLEWATEAENLAASRCGAPTDFDEALLLIARRHGGPLK